VVTNLATIPAAPINNTTQPPPKKFFIKFSTFYRPCPLYFLGLFNAFE
jgi:hypothetical protein